MRQFLLNTLVFLFCCAYAQGQVYFLDEHFNSAPAVPATMTGSSPLNSLTSVSNYGRNSPSLQFRVTGQYIQYGPWASAADQVSFFHKCTTGGASTFLVEESLDGFVWTTVGTAMTITTAATFTAPLLSTSRYLRLTFTLGIGLAYTMIDDLRVRQATTLCTVPPRLLELLVNGTCGTCEGAEEFVFFDTGGNPFDIRYMELVSQTVYAGGCAYGGNGTGDNLNTNWVLSGAYTAAQNNYIANLNLWAGCAGVFVPVPPGNVLPAGVRSIAFTGANPTAPYNFSSICSLGTVYILFADQTNCNGKYANGACSSNCTRYLTLFNHLTGCVDNQQYFASPTSTTAGNGYIFVDPGIGYTTTATCSFLILSAKLKLFNLSEQSGSIQLNWTTVSEENMREYVVQRSDDGIQFKTIGNVYSLNSTSEENYSFTDGNPLRGKNYYRLILREWNDHQEFSHIVEMDYGSKQLPFTIVNDGQNVVLKSNSDIFGRRLTIYSASGQKFYDRMINLPVGSIESISSSSFSSGIYFIQVSESNFDVMKLLIR